MNLPTEYEHLTRYDFRDAVFGAIEELLRADKCAILLTNDMGAAGLDKIAEFAPERVINVGIAEQNMISVASGMALSGHRVFVYGIISHIVFRALEQIKLDICVQNLSVVIVGVGAGLAYGVDGPTHHATEDIAAMRCLPNMAIYNPSDYWSARECVYAAYSRAAPGFLRMDKENLPELDSSGMVGESGCRLLGDSGEGLIIGTGVTVWSALSVKEILSKRKIETQVLDIVRLKPLAQQDIKRLCSNKKWVVLIEESSTLGGMHETIARVIIGSEFAFFLSFNLGDGFILGSAKREWVWEAFGLAPRHIADAIVRELSGNIDVTVSD